MAEDRVPLPQAGAQISERTRNLHRAVLAHADDLLAGAGKLLPDLPHLAYHLAVLALEEVGRASLLVMLDIAAAEHSEAGIIERGVEDHVDKLFWAFWGPSFGREVITKAQVDQHRELARHIHEKRKAGLYFDMAGPPPREAVTAEEARGLMDAAAARIGLERSHVWAPLEDEDAAQVRWFVEHARDPELRGRIFGPESMVKLSELGTVPEWVAWLRSDIEANERAGVELAQHELASEIPEGAEGRKAKWRIKFRIVSDSHSIRQRPLNWWNQRGTGVQLRLAHKDRREIAVELTVPKQVPARALYPAGLNMANTVVLALNMGSHGLFWWYLPQKAHLTRFYDELVDLEKEWLPIIERTPALRFGWGNLVLTEEVLGRVVLCYGGLLRSRTPEQREAIEHYRRGIVLLAKTDVFMEFQVNAFEQFYLALRQAMRAYGHWDGVSPLAEKIDAHMRSYEGFPERRERYLALAAQIDSGQLTGTDIDFGDAGWMKLLAEGFFIRTFNEMLRATRSTSEETEASS